MSRPGWRKPRSKAFRAGLGVLSLGLSLLAGVAGCSAGASRHLLITIDTLRADHLGAWGYPRDVSPTIDRLAAEGFFRAGLGAVAQDRPSFASILTSTYPKDNGIVPAESACRFPSPCDCWPRRFLGRGLRHHGRRLRTAPFPPTRLRLRGFDSTWRPVELPDLAHPQDGGRAAIVNREVLARLDRLPGDRPWFLWVHYLDPHFPYDPPSPWRERYTGDAWDVPGAPLPIVAGHGFGQMGGVGEEQILGDRRDLSYYRALYDAEIRYTDDSIAELLAAIEARSDLEDAVTVVTADHGESLGEHRYFFDHGRFGFETCLHVPLVVHAPGRVPTGSEPLPVELIDLAPTLLELAGVPLEDGRWMQGKSLASHWSREGVEPVEHSYAHAEAGYATEERWQKIVRDERFKLIYAPYAADQRHIGGHRQPFALYDLRADPGELVNLVDREPSDFQRLVTEVRRWWQPRSFDVFVDDGTDLDTSMSEETRQQLEALGYLN
ncbi:MAG: sulfatase-like hydrolase/transferase [Thermoanaerobaculia bacterium]